MNDTVSNENVRGDDLGAVDIDGAVHDGDGDVAALHGRDHAVIAQAGAVRNSSIDD